MRKSKEPRFKPLVTDTKFNIIGLVVTLGAILGIFLKWQDFQSFFLSGNSALNWRFFALSIILSASIVWFVMNNLWKQEYEDHEITKKDRDNLLEELKVSENERLTDIITGIPNSRSLEKDIEDYFSAKHLKNMQFILIDLKGFREINKKYGFSKTNDLLRLISQTIYKRMRRNEDMYKYFDGENKKLSSNNGFYRIYPGGDEFAFIIEGDQADAIGFANRLVDQFSALSEKASDLLGHSTKLSFYCAIIEMDPRDTYNDILKKVEDCYQIAKEGKSDFNICWHPINKESILSKDSLKCGIYKKSRELFEVLTLTETN